MFGHHHGGALKRAMEAFPEAPTPWLDLSTGINPTPWPIPADLHVAWHRLPEMDEILALEAAAAAAFGVAAARVCAVPGTELALRSLARLDLPRPVHHLWPSYATHGEAVQDSRAIGLEDIIACLSRGGTVILANPNNPDGRILSSAALMAALQAARRAGGCLVVDEAYADAHDDVSLLPFLAPNDPVIVLRSFGKFYGLPGLRLGFVVASAPVIARLRSLLGSWPVSAAAVTLGRAAYGDMRWQQQTRRRLRVEAAALDAVLRDRGHAFVGGCPLFRLVIVADADALFRKLARRGILTRPFNYEPRWLRIGLSGAAHLGRLREALGDE